QPDKARLVKGLRDQHPLALLLLIAGIARSSFYYHVHALKADDKYADLKQRISGIYHHHKGRYGYRRITQTLKSEGLRYNHKLIARLMNELKLSARIRRQKYRSYKGQCGVIAKNR
ncbi:IS3 family transposase, partial [Psychrobacter sp. UBA3483]|uniref:IS3 family transposase n=1 Tax=Psychrobacter sp. UBA3483 TaxID=1947351 RepID=UPI0025F4DF07